MNLYQCQRKAEKIGFDKAKFFAVFPVGLVKCQWIDAYVGIFKVDADKLGDGFVTIDRIDQEFPDLQCTDPYIDESILN